MTDAAPADSLSNVAEFTVSEISFALKRTVEETFGHVRVRGEISGYRGPHSSGHAYFVLKDERARLEAVIWKTTFARLRFHPEEGMEVIATGRLTTYPGSSKYQIVIEQLEPAGVGALMALLEERKRRLAAEGLFEQARKKKIPFMPRVVGVVTSPTGAVIRDIIHRITDRFPLHVLVWPVRVQGETAGAEAAAAVAGFNALEPGGTIPRPDLIIVARGGGSLEDLWGFNDEALVRAVAASRIPVISAVGHETDWTLIDLVADLRAPTPTGAAELAVPVKADLEAILAGLAARLAHAIRRGSDRRREALKALTRALPATEQILAMPRQRFDAAAGRLMRALVESTARRRLRLQSLRLQPTTLSRRIGELSRGTEQCGVRLARAAERLLRMRRVEFDRIGQRLVIRPFLRRTSEARTSLLSLAGRLDRCLEAKIQRCRLQLDQAERVRASLDHRAVLARGFALVRDEAGEPVTRAAAVRPAVRLSLQFADGEVDALAAGERPRASRSAASPTKAAPRQGTLF
jgi:exodeoxyribonuclease VII large subunit